MSSRARRSAPESRQPSGQASGRACARRSGSAPHAGALAAALGCAALLQGCATYRPLPLARRSNLVGQIAALRWAIPPAGPGQAPRRIFVERPLDIDDMGLLAALNDPALRAAPAQMDLTVASLLQSALLPNPAASISYGALLGGAGGVAPEWSASLTEDVKSILTYRNRVESARLQAGQVNAELLWQEWQVAEKARLLALDLYWGGRALELGRRELRLLDREVRQVQAATRAGDLALTALAPLLAAQAAARQSVAAISLSQMQSGQALDALLGLEPNVRIAIARPRPSPLPRDLGSLLASLPDRRPDLIALQLGYRSADEDVRAAIIGQFPALSLGGQWTQDNTNVRNGGPAAGFDLPLFGRNQGQVGKTRATRLLLREQYQSRLDAAIGGAQGLAAQAKRLARDAEEARGAAAAAEALARSAERAYAQGAIDQRSLADFQATALERRLEAIALERSLGESEITLAVELGLGLPQTRIGPAADRSASASGPNAVILAPESPSR